MAVEKKWLTIPARLFTANGTEDGVVTISDTADFKVKMRVSLYATGFEPILLEVKRVLSPTKLKVGPIGLKINVFEDITDYTTAISSTIGAAEQDRNKVPPEDYERAVYEEEPTMAKRVVGVDKYGNFWSQDNPLPVEAIADIVDPSSISIQEVNTILADTEYIVSIPESCKRFTIKVREDKAMMKIGTFTTSTVIGPCATINRGANFNSMGGMDFIGIFTLYVSVTKANCILEVVCFEI